MRHQGTRHRPDPSRRTPAFLARLALVMCLAAPLTATGPVAAALPDTDGTVVTGDTVLEACPQGPSHFDRSFQRTTLNSVVTAGPQAWAVGMRSISEDARSIVAARWDGTAWREVPVADRGGEQALFAMDRSPEGQLWAAGYRTVDGLYRPQVMRWSAGRWRRVDLGRAGRRVGVLTGMDARTAQDIWAVGYHSTRGGQRPSVMRGSPSTGWRSEDPPVPPGATGAFMDISAEANGGVWAVGWTTVDGIPRPHAARRSAGRWQRTPITGAAGREGALTSVIIQRSGLVWAVGYRVSGGRYLPMVLRWDGRRWALQRMPDVGSDIAVLRAIELDADRRPIAAGTRWDAELGDWRGFVLARAGGEWQLVEAPVVNGGSDLRDVAGSRSGTTWAVGSSARRSLAFEVCATSTTTTAPDDGPPPPVGTSAPELPDPDVTSPPAPGASPSGEPAPSDEPGPSGQPTPSATPIPSPRTIKARAGGIPIVARDVASEVGLAMRTTTYGSIATDIDADGWPDLFIGRHANPGWLVRNTGGAFEPAPGVEIARRDRHGCTAGDANGDGRVDFYCAIGAVHGANLKANELLIQQPDGTFLDQAVEMRAADPLGRGRMAVFFDLDHDDHADLFVADRPDRTDGLPSRHRVLVNPTGDQYRARSVSGFDVGLGADCVRAADLDGDGWEDIVLCARAKGRSDGFGVRILRNMKGRLVDVTTTSGIEPIDALDAIVADMDGDGRPDIVEIAPWELRVLLRRGERYVVGYQRTLAGGVGIAAGDVDADGDLDLYVVLGTRAKQRDDLLLINRGDGRRYGSMTIPQTRTGSAESVTAIDHDRNGLMDFLVLNGRGSTFPGPIQLIAFFPTTPVTGSRGRP
ncbi:MAG: VCBS repeat-containing protein [Chloroflexi bacterium]|nr:VCBS repeat-containing protein [Chloroflexota bacterium]